MNKIVLQSFFRENRYNPESFHPFLSESQVLSKTSDPRSEVFVLALPIFPGSHPPSIVGANELNFCVRDGNRWTLAAINTNFVVAVRHFMSKTFVCDPLLHIP